jgi:hypothetical protein
MNDRHIVISQLSVARPNNMTVNLIEGELNQSVVVDHKRFYRKKYKLALQLYAKLDMVAYAQTHPEWGAKDVLAEIVKDYDKDLPSEILLEMAEYIVTEWGKIQASKKELVLT